MIFADIAAHEALYTDLHKPRLLCVTLIVVVLCLVPVVREIWKAKLFRRCYTKAWMEAGCYILAFALMMLFSYLMSPVYYPRNP